MITMIDDIYKYICDRLVLGEVSILYEPKFKYTVRYNYNGNSYLARMEIEETKCPESEQVNEIVSEIGKYLIAGIEHMLLEKEKENECNEKFDDCCPNNDDTIH